MNELTAMEQADLALLRRSGMVATNDSGTTVQTQKIEKRDGVSENALSAGEAEMLTFLHRAGFKTLAGIDDAGGSAEQLILSRSTMSGDPSQSRSMSEGETMAFLRQAGFEVQSPTDDNWAQPAASSPPTVRPTASAETSVTALISRPLATTSMLAAKPPAARRSGQKFLILEVATDGGAALANLEAKMGMPFAADHNGKPYWSAAATEAGGTQRAFSFVASQRHQFEDMIGDLGGSSLRLTIASIEVARFKSTGPGATGWAANKGPPQLPQRLPNALRSALGR